VKRCTEMDISVRALHVHKGMDTKGYHVWYVLNCGLKRHHAYLLLHSCETLASNRG
jgi:hypothetical protein